jgi:hypothetical protein
LLSADLLLQLFDPLPGRLKLSLQCGNKIDQPTGINLARVDILFELLKAIHDPSVTNPADPGNAVSENRQLRANYQKVDW